jgi:hypothetical protein
LSCTEPAAAGQLAVGVGVVVAAVVGGRMGVMGWLQRRGMMRRRMCLVMSLRRCIRICLVVGFGRVGKCCLRVGGGGTCLSGRLVGFVEGVVVEVG